MTAPTAGTAEIALVSCRALLPDGDAGDRPLLEALIGQGARPVVVAWDDPVDWDRFALSMLRSTWDYPDRRQEFLGWLPTVPRLHNPAPVVAENTDKTYLRRIAAAGIAVVPSEFIAPGAAVSLPASGEFVLKPTVGAGSKGAGRFDAAQPESLVAARAHAQSLHAAGRTVMIQPYLGAVDTDGETALIFIDGVFSHAIGKAALLPPSVRHPVGDDSLYIVETITARTPTPDELAAGESIAKLLIGPDGSPLLYARIDLLPSPDGPMLIELELTEPSLFLDHEPAAAGRLADAILSRVGSG